MTYDAPDIRGVIGAARQRPLVIASDIEPSIIEKLIVWVAAIPSSAWSKGDLSERSWDEHALTRAELNWLINQLQLVAGIAALSDEVVGWINRFGYGTWIAAHRDAGGDVQCIIPLELPLPDEGGALWVGSSDQSVPMQAGDLIVFNAAALSHGTSRIVAPNAQRITINLRFWISQLVGC
jgi:hypothetical protein